GGADGARRGGADGDPPRPGRPHGGGGGPGGRVRGRDREVPAVAGASGPPPAPPGLRDVMMDCSDAQLHLLDYQRGRLAADLRGEIRTHREGCPACRDEEVAERELTTLLDRRPRYPASGDLKRRLAAGWTPAPAAAASPRAGWRRWATSLAPALATAAV